MRKQLAALTATTCMLTALASCATTNDASTEDQHQATSQQAVQPMTKQEAADAYLQAVEPLNAAGDEYNLAFYTFDMDTIAEAASKAADQCDAIVKEFPELEWPDNVKDDISTLVDNMSNDADEYRKVAEMGSFDEFMNSTIEFSSSTVSSDIREKLGLPAPEASDTDPVTVNSISVGPLEYGYRDLTITVTNNLPGQLRYFSVDFSVKDQNGNTITTGTAWQSEANADPGTTVPATATLDESVPAGSIIEVSAGSIVDSSTYTGYAFEFVNEQPTGTVQ